MENFKTIQLLENSKSPAVSGWSGASPEKLDAFTMITDRTKNYGVLCGEPSGFIGLDYDIYKLPTETRKNINLDSLKGIHGDDCIIIETPSGGFHVYHLFNESVAEWKGLTGIDGYLDIRTTGNYLVGAGSKIDGNEYRVIHQGEKLSPVPDELFKIIDEKMGTKLKKVPSSQDFDRDEVQELLEAENFTGIKWISQYGFDCDQRGKRTSCPLCNQTHTSNHYFVFENEVGIFVKNHSNKCSTKKLKSKFLFTDEEKEQIEVNGLEEDYVMKKREFEKTSCFIQKTGGYVTENKDGSVSITNLKSLKERFSNWLYRNTKGEKKSFVEAWMKDVSRREYLDIDFVPENCPKTTFNLWKGYEVENVIADGSGDIQPFLDLADQLTEHNTDYFMKWLAFLFQHPGSKPITSPVFTSVEGTGKNSFFDLIARMMGNDLYFETGDADNQVFGRFATALEKNKLLFMDEMEGSVAFKHQAKIKSIITNERHTIERKNVDSYEIKNLSAVVFASNNPTPVKVSGSDRRFFVYRPQKVLDQKFFDTWRVWVKNPQNQRAVYDYLMALDVEDVNWISDRPVSSTYQEMKYNALPSFIKWLDYTICDNFQNNWINRPVEIKTLYDSYKSFGHTNEKNVKSFGLELKKLIEKEDLKGFEKTTPSHGYKRYFIDRQKVFDWLKEKGYTLSTELELPLEIELNNNDDY